ncbi:mismatch repair ATPase MSH1 [Nakaseomyces bracarensis]|uniref:mismatch repair ATPase MSH1 n=1 Tax=Nakaseomyces bracarensis TaxID=273131 RepID=UPI0038726837
MLKALRPVLRTRIARIIRYQHSQRIQQVLEPSVTKLKITVKENGNIPDIRKNEKPDTVEKEIDLPPSLQYVQGLMNKYPKHVVLTQMGSFFELYFEQATKYAPVLNITLTQRNYNQGKVPFAGFPISQLSRHLKALVDIHGFSVVVAEQFKKDDYATNENNRFYRRITRIVTPGTFIDEALDNYEDNNYLLTLEFPVAFTKKVADPDLKVGLCWCDLSTGELYIQEVFLKDLINAVNRIKPKEILLDEREISDEIISGDWYPQLNELKRYFINYYSVPTKHKTLETYFKQFSNSKNPEALKRLKMELNEYTQKELAALHNLLRYTSQNLPDTVVNFEFPKRESTTKILQIDSRTSKALELHSTIRDNNQRGSLFTTIRRTITPVGTRLLAQWLSAPSLDIQEIRFRQYIVETFIKDTTLLTETVKILKDIQDIIRLLQKFNFGRGSSFELLELTKSLQSALKLQKLLADSNIRSSKKWQEKMTSMIRNLESSREFLDTVNQALNEEGLIRDYENDESETILEKNSREHGKPNSECESMDNFTMAINISYSTKIQSLIVQRNKLIQDKEKLSASYKTVFVEELGAKTVTLKQNQSGEYVLHLTGSSSVISNVIDKIKLEEPKSDFKILQKSTQTCWLAHQAWNELANKLEMNSIQIRNEENYIINGFVTQFIEMSEDVRRVAQTIGYIDVLASFATLSKEKNLVRPVVDKSRTLLIENGRHIMVEDSLQHRKLDSFTANDCNISNGSLLVISGPNMGGKSTYLRQNAIIVILAQMGCFVPCTKAHIGYVDKLYSRVGSADDLYNDMSTFMVEMMETSFILNGATSRSMAILDEIGRGTSGNEGIAIAYASLNYLLTKNKCRTLFATHFAQQLKLLIDQQLSVKEKVSYFHTTIRESEYNEKFYYDHKMRPGISTQSDAIKVARIAGFPRQATQEAFKALQALS